MGESGGIDSSGGRAMPKAYSADIRMRVIARVEGGSSRREAAEQLDISPSAAVKVTQHRFRRCFSRCRSDPIKLGDRAQNLAAMPKQNAEILEVLLRQIAEDRQINGVVGTLRSFDIAPGLRSVLSQVPKPVVSRRLPCVDS